MSITKLDQMFEVLKERESKRLVAVWANDAHTIEAVSKAVDMGIVAGTLVGDPAEIEKVCNEENIDIKKFTVVPAETDAKAASISVDLINKGEGDLIMKGLLSTDKYMRAILNKEKGLMAPKAVLTHITVVENPHYHKLILCSDVAVIPKPDLAQKVAITNYLIHTAKSLGIETPKVAYIAASEQVSNKIESSYESAILAKMGDRGQIKGAILEGPLALDLAIDKESAEIKGMTSEVCGDADCLVFPNIEAGNVFYKTNTKLCNADLGAIVAGAKAPAILSSRGDSVSTKLYSIALAALSAK